MDKYKPSGCLWMTFATILAIANLSGGGTINVIVGIMLLLLVFNDIAYHIWGFSVGFGPFRVYFRNRRTRRR